MKVLVVGASGFVGKAIVRELERNSMVVYSVGGPRSMDSDRSAFASAIDISDPKSVASLEGIKDVDAVFQAAGLAHRFGTINDQDLWNVNVAGTENIANLAVKLGVRQFMLISSVLVYGNAHNSVPSSGILFDEDRQCRPIDAYGKSKLDGENVAIAICESAGIPLTILRPAPILGEGSKGNVSRLIKLIAKRRFIWIGDGRNRKSLVAVEDVAKACVTILKNKRPRTEIFNVAGPPMEMREIVKAISMNLGRRPPAFQLPSGPFSSMLGIASKHSRSDSLERVRYTLTKWLTDDVYSCDKIKENYGFAADSDLKDALRSEVDSIIDKA